LNRRRFSRGTPSSVVRLRAAALEAAGVIFLDNDEGHGVKLKSKPKPEVEGVPLARTALIDWFD